MCGYGRGVSITFFRRRAYSSSVQNCPVTRRTLPLNRAASLSVSPRICSVIFGCVGMSKLRTSRQLNRFFMISFSLVYIRRDRNRQKKFDVLKRHGDVHWGRRLSYLLHSVKCRFQKVIHNYSLINSVPQHFKGRSRS